MLSMPDKTVAPVVVRPDTASNRESVIDMLGLSDRSSGIAPDKARAHPEHQHHDEAVAQPQLQMQLANREPKAEADDNQQHEGAEEGYDGTVVVKPRDQNGAVAWSG